MSSSQIRAPGGQPLIEDVIKQGHTEVVLYMLRINQAAVKDCKRWCAILRRLLCSMFTRWMRTCSAALMMCRTSKLGIGGLTATDMRLPFDKQHADDFASFALVEVRGK